MSFFEIKNMVLCYGRPPVLATFDLMTTGEGMTIRGFEIHHVEINGRPSKRLVMPGYPIDAEWFEVVGFDEKNRKILTKRALSEYELAWVNAMLPDEPKPPEVVFPYES
jgi:hypothetical protein